MLTDETNPSQPPALPAPSRLADLLDEVAVVLRPLARSRGLLLATAPFADGFAAAMRDDAALLRQAVLHAGRWALGVAEAGPVQLLARPVAATGDELTLRVEWSFTSRQAAPGIEPAGREGGPASDALAPAAELDAELDADLATVRQLAAQLRGHSGLQAVSHGQWCCWFTARVRLDEATPPGTAAASWAGQSHGPSRAGVTWSLAERLRQAHAGRRVLVVEDDKVNQLVMLELLRGVGLVAETADDGQEALNLVGTRTYALVAMDLRMPRLDGLGAARALRAMPSLDHTPIIAVTANAFDEDRAACRAAGMNDFIPKPIDVDHLYAVLLHWLDRSPVGRPAPEPLAPALPSRPAAAGIDPALRPLLGLEGVDALGGLGSVGGRVATYRRLLNVFIDAHQADGQALEALLHDNEAEAAGRVAHRLRGSAATLGLVDVETAAARLESGIDRGDRGAVLAPGCAAVQEALAAAVQALRTALAA
ncbi:MAG: hypothetical protein RJA10_4788 [Pseudomonadota bacterium]|jgi:two-component system, sensor histidine kinase and response regulator